MTTQKDVTEVSASESENVSKGDVDDEDAGEESLETSSLASPESEEAPVSISTEAELQLGRLGTGLRRRSSQPGRQALKLWRWS